MHLMQTRRTQRAQEALLRSVREVVHLFLRVNIETGMP